MSVQEFLTTSEMASQIAELRTHVINLSTQVLELTAQSRSTLEMINQLAMLTNPEHVASKGSDADYR